MNWLGDNFAFEKFNLSDKWGEVKDDPMRLLYGGGGPPGGILGPGGAGGATLPGGATPNSLTGGQTFDMNTAGQGGGYNPFPTMESGGEGGGFMDKLGNFENWQQMLGNMQGMGGGGQQQQQPDPYRGGGASNFNPNIGTQQVGAQMPMNMAAARMMMQPGMLEDDTKRQEMLQAMMGGGLLT